MKKIIYSILFSSIFGQLFAQELDAGNRNNVCRVVQSYCALLSGYTESRANIGNREKIYQLFPNETGDVGEYVVDDLSSDPVIKMTDISNYLSRLSSPDHFNYTVKISYLEDVYDMAVSGLSKSNHNDKSAITHGRIKLTKQFKGGLEKTTDNVFHIKLGNSKIERIFAEAESEADETDITLLDKAMQAKAAKRYAEALEYFEKSAQKGNLDAMYQVGFMLYAKQGCEKLSRKERRNRGYYWLSRAARPYSPYQQYWEDDPIALSRELLDRMGYYNR
jgi:hypothetical protein